MEKEKSGMRDDARQEGKLICSAAQQLPSHYRPRLIAELVPHFYDIAHRLAQESHGSTYQVVLSQPVGGALNLRSDGLYDAFVKGSDGKIQAVARLKEVGPSLLTTASCLAGHAMLARISNQLNVLKADVDTLLRIIVGGELGKVIAGIRTLRTIQHYNERHRDQVLLDTAAHLKLAIGAATQQAIVLIAAVPEPPRLNVYRVFLDTSPETVDALARAAEAVKIVVLGLQALGEAEVLLNNNVAAAQIMRYWFNEIKEQLDLKKCEHYARAIPANSAQDRHEIFWMKVDEAFLDSQVYLDNLINEEVPLKISVPCTNKELSKAANHSNSFAL